MLKTIPLTYAHITQATNVLVDAFSTDPWGWGKALDRDPENLRGWMQNSYIPLRAEDGQSFVGTLDSQVVGVLAIENFGHEHETRGDQDKGMIAIQSILTALDNIFLKGLNSKPQVHNENAYFAFICVDPTKRRMKIADSMLKYGFEDCVKRKSFDYCVAHCVSPVSASLFSRNGFECWGMIKYKEFVVDSEIPFHKLSDECKVMVKKCF